MDFFFIEVEKTNLNFTELRKYIKITKKFLITMMRLDRYAHSDNSKSYLFTCDL